MTETAEATRDHWLRWTAPDGRPAAVKADAVQAILPAGKRGVLADDDGAAAIVVTKANTTVRVRENVREILDDLRDLDPTYLEGSAKDRRAIAILLEAIVSVEPTSDLSLPTMISTRYGFRTAVRETSDQVIRQLRGEPWRLAEA